jgi:uncharacterized membrane protein YciS (DUF1049 family)
VLLTFAAVTLAWVVFRAQSMNAAWLVLRGLVGQGQTHLVPISPLAAAALVTGFVIVWLMPNSMQITWKFRPALASQIEDVLSSAGRLTWRPNARNALVYGALCIVAILALSSLSPFIYFQF